MLYLDKSAWAALFHHPLTQLRWISRQSQVSNHLNVQDDDSAKTLKSVHGLAHLHLMPATPVLDLTGQIDPSGKNPELTATYWVDKECAYFTAQFKRVCAAANIAVVSAGEEDVESFGPIDSCDACEDAGDGI